MLATGGGSPFDLQHGGWGTCALVYKGELVMMGGRGRSSRSSTQGHVDR